MTRRLKWVWVLVGLVLAQPALAGLDLQQLARLVDEGRNGEAYALASRYLEAREGEPRFDYLYGIAAIDSGHLNEGVFALERVLITQPGNRVARLELARGYYLMGDFEVAKQEFNHVLHLKPPSRVEANIERFLAAIRQQEQAEGQQPVVALHVEVGFGYDTNVNTATADANFFSPLFGQGTLNQESLQKGDYFHYLATGGRISYPVSASTSLFGELDAQLRGYHDLQLYDTSVVSIQGGVQHLSGNEDFRLGVIGQRFYLDEILQRLMLGGTAEWGHAFDKQSRVTLTGQVATFEYPDLPGRDAKQITVGIGGVHQLQGDYAPLLFTSLFRGFDDADTDTESAKAAVQRSFGGVRIGGQMAPRGDLSLQASLTRQYSDYDGREILFSTSRQDVNYLFDTGLVWLPRKQWSLRLNYSYTKNHSNIPIYEYERQLTQLGVRYDFF